MTQPSRPMKRLLRRNKKNTECKVYKDDFKVTDETPIGFGKLRGKPHSTLLQPEWNDYCVWLIDQSDKPSDFRYQSTRKYVLDRCEISQSD